MLQSGLIGLALAYFLLSQVLEEMVLFGNHLVLENVHAIHRRIFKRKGIRRGTRKGRFGGRRRGVNVDTHLYHFLQEKPLMLIVFGCRT